MADATGDDKHQATGDDEHQAKGSRLEGPSDIQEKLGMIPSMAALLRSMDRRLCQIATTWFHQLLLNEPSPPVKEVVRSCVVYVFILCLTSDEFKELQEKAAEILIFIASGTSMRMEAWDSGRRTSCALSCLLNSADEEVLRHGCTSLAVLSGSANVNVKHPIVEARLYTRLYDLIFHQSPSIIIGALRTLGNIMEEHEHVTKSIAELGVLGKLHMFLNHDNVDIRKETCWICGHLSAIQVWKEEVFKSGLLESVVKLLKETTDIGTKRVASKTISIATSGAKDDQIKCLNFENCIFVLCLHLCCKDKQILNWSLEALENIMKSGKEIADDENDEDVNPYAKAMYHVGGWRLLRDLYSSYDYENHFKALKLQKRYSVYPIHKKDSSMKIMAEQVPNSQCLA